MRFAALAHLIFFVGAVAADPPDVPKELKVKPGQLVRVTVKGDGEFGTLKNFTDEEAFWGELVAPKGARQFVFQAPADGKRRTFVVGWWAKGETEGAATTITVDGGGKADEGKKDDVTPPPVTSFRVVMVYESGATLSPTKMGVLFSGDIRDYLDTATTPDAGTKGWRLRDKDASADNDTPTQKAMWAAIKPQITAVPCWAVEVNGKVEIIPLPATVADGLALLRKYKEGK